MEVKFEGVWCDIPHSGKSFISVFEEFSSSINKTFIFAGGLGAGLSFYGVWAVSWYFLISWDPKCMVVWQLVWQLVYTMFISHSRTLFHLWWKEYLVEHRKVWKYYETDCLKYFMFLFMLLLAAEMVKKNLIFRLKLYLSF